MGEIFTKDNGMPDAFFTGKNEELHGTLESFLLYQLLQPESACPKRQYEINSTKKNANAKLRG